MKILDIPQSGKRGQVVAFQSRFGLCLRQLVIPKNTITPARERMRGFFGSRSRMWSGTLSEAQRDRWTYAGSQVMSHPRLGQKGPLSGQQFWQSVSSIRALVGLPLDLEPPAPVVFQPNPVGPLIIENTEAGVRLFVAVSGEPDTDIMLFGQEPCPAGRRKRRNVAYLGLLPAPNGWPNRNHPALHRQVWPTTPRPQSIHRHLPTKERLEGPGPRNQRNRPPSPGRTYHRPRPRHPGLPRPRPASR